MKLLHFADAHIDMANYGRHDPETGLPLRVLDFLKSLDTIVDAAICRESGSGDLRRRRLQGPFARADLSAGMGTADHPPFAGADPDSAPGGKPRCLAGRGRAHAIHEFDTLQVPLVRVISAPCFLRPPDLWDLPLQVIAWPWVSRSGIMASRGIERHRLGRTSTRK